jgi:hypothetical protein
MVTELLAELIGEIEVAEINCLESLELEDELENEILYVVIVLVDVEMRNLFPEFRDAANLRFDSLRPLRGIAGG